MGAAAHSFETHAHARETGTMYGNNQAVERAVRRLRGSASHPAYVPARARAGTMYGANQADECAARRLRRASEIARNFEFS